MIDTNHGIYFESTESYEASQVLMQLAREAREESRLTNRLLAWALCGVIVLAVWTVTYMWTKVPAAYDVPAAMEVGQ